MGYKFDSNKVYSTKWKNNKLFLRWSILKVSKQVICYLNKLGRLIQVDIHSVMSAMKGQNYKDFSSGASAENKKALVFV